MCYTLQARHAGIATNADAARAQGISSRSTSDTLIVLFYG
jgi:hypothetical protein